MNRDIEQQILRDYEACRSPERDPDLEAVHAAIFLEDVFDVVLSDADIDPAVLADADGMARVVARHRRAG